MNNYTAFQRFLLIPIFFSFFGAIAWVAHSHETCEINKKKKPELCLEQVRPCVCKQERITFYDCAAMYRLGTWHASRKRSIPLTECHKIAKANRCK